MATIKEIATLAGVSRGTVDRVLNNRGGVSEATAKRVQEIADRLNYKPNRAGLILAARKKKIKIGVIVFEASNPFFDDVLAGVHAKAQELDGYNVSLLIRQVPFDELAQFNTMEELLAEGINGLMIAPYNSLYIAAEIDRFTDMGIPVVTTNSDILSKRIAYVGCNYFLSGQVAAGLVGRMTPGNDICMGVLTGSVHVLCHTERIAGFMDIIKREYSHIQVTEPVENHDNDTESYEVVSQLLEKHPEVNVLFFTAGGVLGGCTAVLDHTRAASIQIFTYDCVPSTVELIRQNVICATICQNPFQQGYLPLHLLVHNLLKKQKPENELNYTDLSIKIKENL